MTLQKFKPGDKVGIINPNKLNVRMYNNSTEYIAPSTLEPNKEYTVDRYLHWAAPYGVWAVKLVESNTPVSETILAPLLPTSDLAELLAETLPDLIKV